VPQWHILGAAEEYLKKCFARRLLAGLARKDEAHSLHSRLRSIHAANLIYLRALTASHSDVELTVSLLDDHRVGSQQ
jgi:hypothetical protein